MYIPWHTYNAKNIFLHFFKSYRGLCLSRDASILENVPAEEAYIYKTECRTRLYLLDYDTFQGAIKRYGYRIDLNDEHLKSISQDIRLNF